MQTNKPYEMTENELLREAAAAALEEALDREELPDADGIDALLDLLEETGEIAMPAEETLDRQKGQTLRALRKKRRLAPRRILAVAAALAVLLLSAVLGVLERSGKIDLLPSEPSAAEHSAVLEVEDLLESLHAHSFEQVALSQVFLQDGWVATTPTYYNEGDKSCVDFQVYNAGACYCFSLKTGKESAENYAALGAERVLTVEKEVVIYVFGDSANLSEMRYQVNDLSYSVTANVPAQTMIHTANQIEKT